MRKVSKRKVKYVDVSSSDESEESPRSSRGRKHKKHKEVSRKRKKGKSVKYVYETSESDSDSQETSEEEIVIKKRRKKSKKKSRSSDSEEVDERKRKYRGLKLKDVIHETPVEYDRKDTKKKDNKPINCFANVAIKEKETSYRSNLRTAIKEITSVVFTERHLTEIKRTPFWLMFEAMYRMGDEGMMKRCHKYEGDICQILRRFEFDSECFLIGGERVPLLNRDAQLIFGICGGSDEVSLKLEDYNVPCWVKRCFEAEYASNNGVFPLLKTLLYERMKTTLTFTSEESYRDVARLVHCYLLAVVLSPYQSGSCPMFLTTYVENLADVCRYDWSAFVVDFLKKQMKTSKQLKAGGCAIILPFWLCEHTRLVEPRDCESFPRFLKWDMTKLHTELEEVDLVEYQYFRKTVLMGTAAERDKFLQLQRFRDLKNKETDGICGNTEVVEDRGQDTLGGDDIVEPTANCATADVSTDKTDAEVSTDKTAAEVSSDKTAAEVSTDKTYAEEVTTDKTNPAGEENSAGKGAAVEDSSMDHVISPTVGIGSNSNFDSGIVQTSPSFNIGLTQYLNQESTNDKFVKDIRNICEEINLADAVEGMVKLGTDDCNESVRLDSDTVGGDNLVGNVDGKDTDDAGAASKQADTDENGQSGGDGGRVTDNVGGAGDAVKDSDKQATADDDGKWMFLITENDRLAKELESQRHKFEADVNMKDQLINSLRVENEELANKIWELTNPTITQIFENAANMSHLEAVEKNFVEKTKEVVCEDKRSEATVGGDIDTSKTPCTKVRRSVNHPEPSTLVQRVRSRTLNDGRMPVQISPQLNTRELIHINEGVCETVAEAEARARSMKDPLEEKHLAVRKLDDYIRAQIVELFTEEGPSYFVWTGEQPFSTVSLNDVIETLHNKQLSTPVIDSWSDIISQKYYNSTPGSKNVRIFTSGCLRLVRDRATSNKAPFERMIEQRLEQSMNDDILLFPLICGDAGGRTRANGDHWCLLRLNMRNSEWKFYNPMRPRNADPHLNEALVVVKYVEEKLHDLFTRLRPNSSFLTRPYIQPVSEDCLQQGADTVDCGVVVCYLVENIVLRRTLKKGELGKTASNNYRAKMVKWFMDPLSVEV